MSLQQLQHIGFLRLDLVERALPRCLIGPPAQQARAVAKTFAAEMVVADLDHELGLERLPYRRAFGRPAARTTGRVAGEALRRRELLQPRGERGLVLRRNIGGEADVVEQAVVVVEAEQQRADYVLAFVVAEAADDTVGTAVV